MQTHTHYTRFIQPERSHNFVPSAPPPAEFQLEFPFMEEVPTRDAHAPDEIALRIVRGIFRDGEAQGWSLSTDAVAIKVVNHREHNPPEGMPERRKTARQEEKPQPSLRQAMRSPAAQRIDLAGVRETVNDPAYALARQEAMRRAADYSPWRRLVICLLIVVAYAQMLNSPETVRGGWDIVGQFFTNVRTIANTIDAHGIKGWPDKPAGVTSAVAKER